MEDIYKNLKKATEDVIEAQGQDEDAAVLVLSTAGNKKIYTAYHGQGYTLAALLLAAMEDDKKLYSLMKAAVLCAEEEKKKKNCDA